MMHFQVHNFFLSLTFYKDIADGLLDNVVHFHSAQLEFYSPAYFICRLRGILCEAVVTDVFHCSIKRLYIIL